MNLKIRNSKENLVGFAQEYLNGLLSGVHVEFIINGYKVVDTITSIDSEEIEGESFLAFNFKDSEVQHVPLLDETKANIGYQMVVIETKNHTTVIEVLD